MLPFLLATTLEGVGVLDWANLTAVGALIVLVVSFARYLPKFIGDMRSTDLVKDKQFITALEQERLNFTTMFQGQRDDFTKALSQQRIEFDATLQREKEHFRDVLAQITDRFLSRIEKEDS